MRAMQTDNLILVAAGGTGGHLFPAEALSHALMARYRAQYDPAVFTQALEWFSGVVGAEPLGRMLLTFVEEFPGFAVMRGELTARKWLSGETEGVSHWAVALEELAAVVCHLILRLVLCCRGLLGFLYSCIPRFLCLLVRDQQT